MALFYYRTWGFEMTSSHLGKHELFTPVKTYPPMTVSMLASATLDNASWEAV